MTRRPPCAFAAAAGTAFEAVLFVGTPGSGGAGRQRRRPHHFSFGEDDRTANDLVFEIDCKLAVVVHQFFEHATRVEP